MCLLCGVEHGVGVLRGYYTQINKEAGCMVHSWIKQRRQEKSSVWEYLGWATVDILCTHGQQAHDPLKKVWSILWVQDYGALGMMVPTSTVTQLRAFSTSHTHPHTTIRYVIRGALCLEEFTDPVNAVVLEHILLFFEEGTVQSEKSPFRGRGNGF